MFIVPVHVFDMLIHSKYDYMQEDKSFNFETKKNTNNLFINGNSKCASFHKISHFVAL